MSKKWHIEEAGERFSEVVADSLSEGPQFIMSDLGRETAVVIHIGEWRRLKGGQGEDFDIKAWLLAPEARTECLAPPRQPVQHRPPPTFD